MSKICCKNMLYCVNRNIECAKESGFTLASESFINDVLKSDCTKCIAENNLFLLRLLLNDHNNDINKFKKILEGFSINCICDK